MKVILGLLLLCSPLFGSWDVEVILPSVVEYKTTYNWPEMNDGATSATMWLRYFGFIDGDPNTQTDEVNEVIDLINIMYDESIPPYQIEPNVMVLGEAMQTYLSYQTGDYTLILLEESVARHEGPWYVRYYQYDEVWESLKSEINAGRPMLVTVDNGATGEALYIVIVIGYRWRYDINAVPEVTIQYLAIDPSLIYQSGFRWEHYRGACYTTHNCGWGIGYQYKLRLIPNKLHLILLNWLHKDCGPRNNWCDNSDINNDGVVNLADYALMCLLAIEE